MKIVGVHQVSWSLERGNDAARSGLAGINCTQQLKLSTLAVATSGNKWVPILIKVMHERADVSEVRDMLLTLQD